MADRTVTVRLMAQYNQFVAAMGRAGASVKQLGQEIDKATQSEKGRQNLDRVAAGAGVAGLALAGFAGAAVKSAADFDKAMSAVQAATHESASNMAALRAAALLAGKDTAFSATEAAQGEEELAKAGVSTADILSGGLKGALDLAAAGTMSVGEAAETAASAMTQFGLSGRDLPHVADLLAAGAGKAQGDVHDMGMALKMSGLVAHQFGLSVEDTTGALSEFAAAGLVGSDAGTSLKTALLQLANPSKQAADLMDKYGISVYNAQGQFVGLSSLAGQLKTQLGGLSQAQRNSALATIFGSDAIRVASILYKDGAKGVDQWKNKVNDAGYASDTAAMKLDNLSGDLEKLKGSLETALIQSGSGANDAIRGLAQGANRLVDNFASLPKPLQESAVYLSGLAGAGMLAFSAFVKVKGKLAEFNEALSNLGPVGTKAAGVIGKVGKAAGIVGGILAAVQIGSAIAGYDATTVSLSKLSRQLLVFSKNGQTAGAVQKLLGAHLKTFSTDIKQFRDDLDTKAEHVFESLTGLGSVVDDSLYHATQRMNQLDQSMTDLVNSGHGEQAAAVFDRLLKKTKEQGGSIADLRRALPQYSAAVGDMASTEATAATATDKQKIATDLLKGSLEGAIDATQSLSETWSALYGSMASTDQAMVNADQQVKLLTASMKSNGKSLSRSTAAGRANRVAVEGLSKAAADAAQAKYEETGATEDAVKVYNRYKAQAVRVFEQMGYNRKQARALADEYFRMPKTIDTKIGIPGAKAAQSELEKLRDREAKIERDIRVAVKTHAPTGEIDRLKAKLASLRDRTIYLTTVQRYRSVIEGNYDYYGHAIKHHADGGVVDYYANGGMREPEHVAQVAPGGSMRMFAEPATTWEAYIPGDPGHHARSVRVLKEVGRRLGVPVGQMAPMAASPSGAGGSSGSSAPAIASALATRLDGPLREVAAAIRARRVTTLEVAGRQLVHAIDDARRDVETRG